MYSVGTVRENLTMENPKRLIKWFKIITNYSLHGHISKILWLPMISVGINIKCLQCLEEQAEIYIDKERDQLQGLSMWDSLFLMPA